MKKKIDEINATPSKRIYLSIIADYDTPKAICELIDNAIDMWSLNGRSHKLIINIILDSTQQKICVVDNAGGLDKDELPLIVSPGYTRNKNDATSIGIFGVGSKRAVVALAQDISIKTRKYEKTYEIRFDDEWINEDDNWDLDVYEVTQIDEGTTQIELLRLRHPITEEMIHYLVEYLGATYALFLFNYDIEIILNGILIEGISFENWAYPKGFEPIEYTSQIETDDKDFINLEATGGLVLQSSPAGGEYGVYFYCNNRLVARALKTYDVGFYKGIAGKPHADISIMRLIIKLNGPASLMPWNSSKSGINSSTQVFRVIRSWLLAVVKDFTSLARRMSKMEGGWPKNVFNYPTGKKQKIKIDNFQTVNASYLPPLPQVRRRYDKEIEQRNKTITDSKLWTKGLVESIIIINWIQKQKFDQKNRISLILLDSTLEIAFKEYLVNDSGQHYSDKKLLTLFSQRNLVHQEMKKYITLPTEVWKKINYFYNLRCQLIHQRASVNISGSNINDFNNLVKDVLHSMYGLEF